MPTCSCHGQPMWRDGHKNGRQKWRCRVKERARNAERIRVGADATFVGRAHQFRATKPEVVAFIDKLRRCHRGSDV